MKWWNREKVEAGPVESRNYTDAIVTALLEQATGTAITAGATGAMETAAGLWARAFASASVSPPGAAAVLRPDLLAHIGRNLCRGGNGLLYIDTRAAGVVLRPVSALSVWGGVDPSSWRYDFELGAPGGSVPMRLVSADDMVHVRYSYESGTPWLGRGPDGVGHYHGPAGRGHGATVRGRKQGAHRLLVADP